MKRKTLSFGIVPFAFLMAVQNLAWGAMPGCAFNPAPVVATTANLADGIVTTQKLADGAVSGPKVDPSAVTTQGNTFNGPNQLVRLDQNGALPAVDASALRYLPLVSGHVSLSNGSYELDLNCANTIIACYGSHIKAGAAPLMVTMSVSGQGITYTICNGDATDNESDCYFIGY